MAEAALALVTGDPDILTGQVVDSLSLLERLRRPVYDLGGVDLVDGWQPDSLPDRLAAMSAPSNVDSVRRFFGAINTGSVDEALEVVTDDVVYEAPYYEGFGERHGRDALAAMLHGLEDRFSRVRYEVVSVTVCADADLVIAEVRGDLVVKASGSAYRNTYTNFVRFRGGRVSHWRELSNPDIFRSAFAG
jgi:ketosteroid isomerase-like protein